jgi:hypothetical protein
MQPEDRLLLAKYFYTRGSDILRERGLFDPGLAVSLFQDAVEIALLACGSLVDAAPKDKIGFEPLWEEVSKALAAASRAPLRMKIEMLGVNKARVGFKHSGQVPDIRVAEACRLDTGQFLGWATTEYFGRDFLSLSLVTFVLDDVERGHLQSASDRLGATERREALLECSAALSHIHQRRHQFYGHGVLVQYGDVDPKVRQYVNNEIVELRKQLWDVSDLVFAEACGVSASDFLVVRQLLPKQGGSRVEYPAETEWLTDENARRCIEFVAQYSIGLSRRLSAPQRFFAARGLV